MREKENREIRNIEDSGIPHDISLDLILPRLETIKSSLTGLLLVYAIGLSLMLGYLLVLKIFRDIILEIEDPFIRNIMLIGAGGILTITWLYTWFTSVKKIRSMLARSAV
ncbi:MAG: hypothetical protein QXU60_00575 [Sulfolobales archaeon]